MVFDYKGTDIYYTDSTSGEKTLIFLHGWGVDSHSFDFILPYFTDCRIIVPDLPGHGKSKEPPCPWSADNFAEAVIALADSLEVKNPILIGHSNGGRVIISMLGKYGYGASKAVLCDSAGIVPKRTFKYRAKVFRYKAAKHIIKLIYGKKADEKLEKLKSKNGSADYRNASGVMRDTMVKLVNTDLRSYLPSIKIPVLLVWGTLDTDTPIEDALLMEKLIPDSGIARLEGATHWAFAQQPAKFIAILKSFIGGTDS